MSQAPGRGVGPWFTNGGEESEAVFVHATQQAKTASQLPCPPLPCSHHGPIQALHPHEGSGYFYQHFIGEDFFWQRTQKLLCCKSGHFFFLPNKKMNRSGTSASIWQKVWANWKKGPRRACSLSLPSAFTAERIWRKYGVCRAGHNGTLFMCTSWQMHIQHWDYFQAEHKHKAGSDDKQVFQGKKNVIPYTNQTN